MPDITKCNIQQLRSLKATKNPQTWNSSEVVDQQQPASRVSPRREKNGRIQRRKKNLDGSCVNTKPGFDCSSSTAQNFL
jgi:hypothetical protein